MKKFILKTLLGFVIVSFALFTLDKIVTYGLSKSSFNTFKDLNDLYNNRINADIVLLGSSRTYAMMNPEILDSILKLNTYNFGQDGATIELQKAIFDDVLINTSPSLKTVVQNIDLTTLLPNKSEYFKEKYYPHLHRENLYNNLLRFDKTIWKYRYIPLYKYGGSFSTFLRGLLLSLDIPIKENYTKIKGYNPRDKKWNNDFSNYKKSLKTDKIFYDEFLIEEGFKILEEFIDETAKMKINYCLVFSPMYSEMYEMQMQNKILKRRLEYYAFKYKHVSFYDYSKLPMNSNKNYFYNSYHLNSKGSDIFSERLANDLKISLKIEN